MTISTSSVAHSRDILPMSVANMTFLVNRLGEDCGPLQFVRELTVNAMQGIELLRKPGEIVWDVDWNYYNLSSIYKLCCIDTGVGMTGEEMVEYINKLSSSIHEQSTAKNFGVGAKIAAAPRNHQGLVYQSWKDGKGAMIWLYFDPKERIYGLKRWPQNNGEFWAAIGDELKPEQIKKNGTVVTLLGGEENENTMQPPPFTPMPSRWILRYLNTRFFSFPKGVTVKAREGWELPRKNTKHNFLRNVEGQEMWLNRNCRAKGQVPLTGAIARWWILKEGIDVDSGHNAPGGHMAALYQNELYEMVTGRAGIGRLQAFGVIFGSNQVVIYVEPLSSEVTSTTARTSLLIEGKALDWAGWAAEFREHLPDEISYLQEEINARSGEKDHRKAISERLKQIRDLLRFSRFHPSEDGSVTVEENTGVIDATNSLSREKKDGSSTKSGPTNGRAGDVFALYAESGASRANPISGISEPETKWITSSNDSRIPPDLEDRAAKYLIQHNLITINADFRVFTDMVDRWAGFYSNIPGSRGVVEDVVHEWFEQQLLETVMSALALRSTGTWSIQELEKLWNEEALTAAVLPRWHIDGSIRRMLGQRLGTLKAA